MTVIDVRDVRKAYAGRSVVDGVSFAVEKGEIFGILGPNGAGKTTLVECIEGLREQDGGDIQVLGLDPRRDGAQLRRVLGAQLQESKVPARLKVWEALDLYSSFYADPLDWVDLLDMLDLTDQRGTAFGQLSGGQQQRLSVALALVGRPKVAVLDELTTGLDPQARRDTWTLIEQVRDSGVTILLVTHFMDEAERLCNRLAIIDRGRVVGLDSPSGLVSQFADEQRLRFVPSAEIDERLLGDLDEVSSVAREGRHVVVTGGSDVVHAVMALLVRERISPDELRVEQQSLEDAFVALTGRAFDPSHDAEVK